MKYPSKRVHELALLEEQKIAAFHANDYKTFKEVAEKIMTIESQPDIYTCLCCGSDFLDGPHVDILVASILVFGEEGTVVNTRDWGILATEKQEAGRRFKICSKCVKKWKHHPLDYAELR